MASATRELWHGFSPLKSIRKSDEVFDQIALFIRNGRFERGAPPVLGATRVARQGGPARRHLSQKRGPALSAKPLSPADGELHYWKVGQT